MADAFIQFVANLASVFAIWSKTELAVGLAAVFSMAFGLLKAIHWVWDKVQLRRKGSVADREARSLARQSFSENSILLARANFVEQSCSNLDPGKELDLRATVSVQEPIIDVLERELAIARGAHILVLADSGMGKTTLLVNLLARDLDLPIHKRRGLVLITLARDDALERISQIRSKSEKVLLLDAFDEDPEAIRDHKSRLAEIMRASRDFGAMVLTCRTQFFSHDEEIPREVGTIRIDPRPAGEDQSFVFRKLYLLPYSDRQIRRYLRNCIPWWNLAGRRKGKELVLRIRDLAARPMLLALVPELVKTGNDVREIYQLYEFMVEMWFKREKTWVERDTLLAASKLLAVDMILGRERRGAESVPSHEVPEAIRQLAKPIEKWKLEGRSLLNRDHSGNLKFSHRSIMEYFFVVAFLEGKREALTIPWTDQMREFLFSWGRCTDSAKQTNQVAALFKADLRNSRLLPVARDEHDDRASPTALSSFLALPAPRAVIRGFPESWCAHSTSVSKEPGCWRVQEQADGFAWTVPQIPRSIPAKQGAYTNYDDVYGGAPVTPAPDHMPWRTAYPPSDAATNSQNAVPTLSQFTLLVLLLAKVRRLPEVLDHRERYWIRGADPKTRCLATVRLSGDMVVDHAVDRGSEQLCMIAHAESGCEMVIGLHKCTSPNTRAVRINVLSALSA